MEHVRTIHHLASTGGTVVCRCIAQLPRVVLLSEVTPSGSPLPGYRPLDPLEQFRLRYPQFTFTPEELGAHFMRRLAPVIEATARARQVLVLRDHAHADFFGDQSPRPALLDALSAHHIRTRSVVTVRYPVNSYLAAKEQGFIDGRMSFGVYCRRVAEFLRVYEGLPIFKYEDFVRDPAQSLQAIAASLGLDHEPAAIARFGEVSLTGNSGRAAHDTTVHPLPMRHFDRAFRMTALESESFREVAAALDYPIDPAEFAVASSHDVLAHVPESAEAIEALYHFERMIGR